MIRDTSLQAYQEINDDGTTHTQRLRVVRFIKTYSEGVTREEIAKKTGLMYSSVCGRVRELIKYGTVYEDGQTINQSGKKARLLKATHSRELS